MIKKLLAGAITAAAMMMSISAANATTVYFTNGTSNSGTFDYTGSDGVDINASALIGSSWGGSMYQSSAGLYIQSYDCDSYGNYDCYNDNTHQIDGYKEGEGVRLTFSEQVNVEKIYFTYVGRNDDFAYRADGSGWTEEDIVGGNYYDTGNGYYSFTLPGLLGTVIDIAALGLNDDFKLKGIDYSTVSAVPLPPAVLMFGAALFGLGWVKRRKAA